MDVQTIPAKTILQKNKSDSWFGNNYNMNIYKGCCHGCIYCDSRSECYRIENFDRVRVKENCLEILRNELQRKVRTGIIGTGSMSDPYNPFEKELEMSRKALMLFDAYNFGTTVITKSDLIVRDKDLYKDISKHSPVLCKMTVTTADDKLCRLLERNVSVSSQRFDALSRLADSGINTGITLMPVLPFIEDSKENILKIVDNAHSCGVKYIYPAFGVTLRQNQREYFLQKLEEIFPDEKYADKYIRQFGNSYNCTCPDARGLYRAFADRCDSYGIKYRMNEIIEDYKRGYGDLQLSFF